MQQISDSRYTADAMPPATRRGSITVLIMLALGAAVWAVIGDGRGMGLARWALLGTAVVIGVVLPPAQRRVVALLNRLRNPSRETRAKVAVLIALLASTYFALTAFHQDRDLFPKTHDEGSYLLGVQMLAHGRLWMPQHELADFFDTFYVINRPVYASLYFPGTALMYTPTVWLGLPTWVLPVLASGAVVGLLYRIVSEIADDGAAGLLAALLMASLSWFRMLTVLLFSQVPTLLLGLLLIWAWLRWRERSKPAWMLAIGAFAGWMAITRPIDALCYALPVAAAIAWTLGRSPRRLATAGACLFAGALPFLSLQGVFNNGVTGRFTQTPYTSYLQRDQPQTSYGFHRFDPTAAPESPSPQKRAYYANFMAPMIQRHSPEKLLASWVGRDDPDTKVVDRKRLAMLIDTTMPFRAMLPVALVGVLGLGRDVRRWVLWLPLPLLILGYAPNTFFLEHYAAVAAPAVLLGVVLGPEVLARAWPRAAGGIRSSYALGVVTIALLSTYELNPVATLFDRDDTSRRRHAIDDETFPSGYLRAVNTQLPDLVQKPAVVLFTYAPGDNVIEEPVYNNAAAWPDDESVIRAHDLGDARNVEIFRYYAARQPERSFYRFDRARNLTYLGTAREALAQTRPSP